MADKNEVQAKPEMNTKLSYYANQYTGLMERDFSEHGLKFDDYSKQCVMASMSAIYSLVTSNKEAMENLPGSNLRQVIGQVASLKLNANAVPRECYFQLRSKQDANGNWHKEVELGIEGDGNDAILRQFGVGIKKVHPVWLVKEGDIFIYPKHKGMQMTPPEWEENGKSQKVIRVVYPVEMDDGNVEYLISERESVKTNLFAHVRNSMMNETFGICKDRYKATDAQKADIKAKKNEILDALRKCDTIEEMLACEVARPYISAAWLDTPEAMIVRKMRNNAIKKYPKNFNAIASQSLLQMDETYQQVQEEIADNANSEDFVVDVPATEVEDESKTETNKAPFEE
ncbi:MAG: recombinase RecT [Lachnospiraceae bacterium]|nr:recombinase RecT [Lachnospiraceae bacterium]